MKNDKVPFKKIQRGQCLILARCRAAAPLLDVRFAPIVTKFCIAVEMSRCANNGSPVMVAMYGLKPTLRGTVDGHYPSIRHLEFFRIIHIRIMPIIEFRNRQPPATPHRRDAE
jgi:hypothetical protein